MATTQGTDNANGKAQASPKQDVSKELANQKKVYKKPTQKPPSQSAIPSLVAFYAFLLANSLAAAFAPIQDCDEVFNYWEPTHYLNRGFGLQTWEYSPEFTIRSWLYIVIHAIIGKFGSLFSSRTNFEFYFIRLVLAMACAACQTKLFSVISTTFNPRMGVMFGMIMIFSPGMFHASVAYLPSSFSMYTTMMGTAAFMDWRGGLKTGTGIMWFGIGAIVGWPFSGILIAPLLGEDLALSSITGDVGEIIWRLLDGIVRSLLFLVSRQRSLHDKLR